jgi:hypothetical protein
VGREGGGCTFAMICLTKATFSLHSFGWSSGEYVVSPAAVRQPPCSHRARILLGCAGDASPDWQCQCERLLPSAYDTGFPKLPGRSRLTVDIMMGRGMGNDGGGGGEVENF